MGPNRWPIQRILLFFKKQRINFFFIGQTNTGWSKTDVKDPTAATPSVAAATWAPNDYFLTYIGRDTGRSTALKDTQKQQCLRADLKTASKAPFKNNKATGTFCCATNLWVMIALWEKKESAALTSTLNTDMVIAEYSVYVTRHLIAPYPAGLEEGFSVRCTDTLPIPRISRMVKKMVMGHLHEYHSQSIPTSVYLLNHFPTIH